MEAVPSIVVFCDLDDTLLELHRFDIDAPARRALSRIEQRGIPIVFSSTKTRAELELIQQELGVRHPFICENGGAVFIPFGYFSFAVAQSREVAGYEVVEFARTNAETVAWLRRTAARLDVDVVGFSDMSVDDVAFECDLPLLQARLAKLREYSEQFRVVDDNGSAIVRLLRALNAAGFECRSRGRYYHLGTKASDAAFSFLRGVYKRAFDDIKTVVFCDHVSGAPLLRQADIPIVVQCRDTDESRRLLAGIPAARPIVADSISAWAHTILEIAAMAQRSRRSSCLS